MRALLFSGGIDSTALAYWLRPDRMLTVDYGQISAEGELSASAAIAAAIDIPHEVLRIATGNLGCGPLAGKQSSALGGAPEWWPYRNQLLITVAAMKYVCYSDTEILIGTVSTDAVHKDGNQVFFDNVNRLLSQQEGSVRVSAPALHMTTEGLVRKSGLPLPVLGWTFSCHTGPFACGNCRGCSKHVKTLQRLGVTDAAGEIITTGLW